MLVAIHQPNYAPWAGYFHKLARADIFIFLDDAQFPKNSYVNRVRILEQGNPVWLTVPAKPRLGAPICAVRPAQTDWPARHLSRLYNAYRTAPAFSAVWGDVESVYKALPAGSLAEGNRMLITGIADRLGLETETRNASSYPNSEDLRADGRLIDLVRRVGGEAYLSGRGGAGYQDPATFRAAGIALEMTDFEAAPYPQAADAFAPGLSILDVVFALGWEEAAAYVRRRGGARG